MTSKLIVLKLILCACATIQAFGQEMLIHGQVSEKATGAPIIGASVMIWSIQHQRILAVDFSDEFGNYQIALAKFTPFELRVNAMGYEKYVVAMTDNPDGKQLQRDVLLNNSVLRLEEVHIHIPKPILVQGDTLSFSVSHFGRGNEKYVNELLKNIPGVQVYDDGTIKYGNKEIEKLMIDGTDLFEKGYQILSLNMPAYPIETVQVLNNFTDNKVLRGVVESDKVAMNLTLKADYRSIWFGNAHLGYGYQPKHWFDMRIDLMNFDKKNQHFLINQYNNVGNRSFDQLAFYLKSGNDEENQANNAEIHSFIHSEIKKTEGIPTARTNHNNEILSSYNSVFSIRDHWKLKINSYLNNDRQQFFQNRIESISLHDLNYHNFEQLQQYYHRKEQFIRLEALGDPSEHTSINSGLDLSWEGKNSANQYTFNAIPLKENIKEKDFRIGHHTNYAYRLSPTMAALLDINLIWENRPQYFQVNDSLMENFAYSLLFLNTEARLLQRKSHEQQTEMTLGHSLKIDGLKAVQSFGNTNSRSYFQYKHHWKPNENLNISLWSKILLNGHSKDVVINRKEGSKYDFIIEPGLKLNWDWSKKHQFNASYSFSTSQPELRDRIPRYIRTGYRSAHKGIENYDYLKTSSWVLGHQYGDWMSGITIYTLAYFMWHHQHISTSTTIHPSFLQTENIWVQSPYQYSIQSTMDYFIDCLSSNLKIALIMHSSKLKNRVLGFDLTDQLFKTYKVSTALRSGFKGNINFHAGINASSLLNSSSLKASGTDHTIDGFTDLYLRIGEKVEFNVLYEWCFLNQGPGTATGFHALDSKLKFSVNQKRLQFELVGENLLDTKFYTTRSRVEYGYSSISYGLLPRHILFKILCRF